MSEERISPEVACSNEDREGLAQKLDKELDDFIGKLKPRAKEEFSKEKFEKELKDHPAFMKELPKDGELPPLVEALQSLKYDPNENTAEELACSYKEDGNVNFKMKKYRWAIQSYTEGIKQDCGNAEINAQLYSNRAASHYHLGNYRSSLNDCLKAIEFKDDHMKALIRAAQCCCHLEEFINAIKWCDHGLKLLPTEKTLAELKSQAEKGKKRLDMQRRKATMQEKAVAKRTRELIEAIKKKNIRIDGQIDCAEDSEDKTLDLSALEPTHFAAHGSRVSLNHDGTLVWPVLLLYPEYGQTDFIQAFHETLSFSDQLEAMFGVGIERPPWDVENKYHSDKLEVYFESTEGSTIYLLDPKQSLLQALMHKTYIVQGGTPTFIILVQHSPFQKEFLKNYPQVENAYFSTNQFPLK